MLDFNPLRREGGDEPLLATNVEVFISIHSAARAETQSAEAAAESAAISIHSAARAETRTRSRRLTGK